MRLALVLDSPRKYGLDYLHQTVTAAAQYAGRRVETRDFFVADPQPGGKSPAIAVIRENRGRLREELWSWQPDAVMSLGAAALNGLSSSPVALAISKQRGRMRWLWEDGESVADHAVRWVPSISHVAAVKNHDLHRDLVNDAYKVIRQLEPLPPMDIDIRVPKTVTELARDLEDLEGATAVGVDVETTGLRPYRDALLAVGIGATYDDVSGIAVLASEALMRSGGDAVFDLLYDAVWRVSRRSVGHNFKFDMQYLERIIDWPPDEALLGDSMLLAHLLDERPNHPTSRVRGLGLKDLVAVRYDFEYGRDNWDVPFDAEQADDAQYLAWDCVYTARLWHDLAAEASDESPRLLEVHDSLVMPVSRALARCEIAGAPIDVPWVRGTVEQLDHEIVAEKQALLGALPAILPKSWNLSPDFNVLAPAQVADVMYDAWGWTPDMRGKAAQKKRSTDRDHIKAAISKYESTQPERAAWVKRLEALRRAVKLRTTYQKSLLDRVDDDGRVRASFLMHGTSTGRLSSAGPNLQNVPAINRQDAEQARPMRRAFAPGPGRVWIEVDYKQLELRVAAAISGDAALTAVFREGRDVHTEVAKAIFSKEDPTETERFISKAVSFGIIYGRSARALAEGAEMDYVERKLGGKRWTEEQATAFIRKFLKDYPGIDSWMTREYADGPARRYVESPYGRRRRFPLIPENRGGLGAIQRQVVNTPVQSAASDICLEALVEVQRRLAGTDLDAVVLFPVHDSICIETPEENVAAVEAVCRDVMEKEWMGVPLEVDFEYGANWARANKWKGR